MFACANLELAFLPKLIVIATPEIWTASYSVTAIRMDC